jgi:hypothetical protein
MGGFCEDNIFILSEKTGELIAKIQDQAYRKDK